MVKSSRGSIAGMLHQTWTPVAWATLLNAVYGTNRINIAEARQKVKPNMSIFDKLLLCQAANAASNRWSLNCKVIRSLGMSS